MFTFLESCRLTENHTAYRLFICKSLMLAVWYPDIFTITSTTMTMIIQTIFVTLILKSLPIKGSQSTAVMTRWSNTTATSLLQMTG